MAKRTDIHRPGALIPADYNEHLTYSLGGPFPIPAWAVCCTTPVTIQVDGKSQTYVGAHGTGDRCCVEKAEQVAHAEGRAVFGARGRCGVCGARYKDGAIFKHGPTGALVHMGRDCAMKYEILADWEPLLVEKKRQEKTKATTLKKLKKEKERADFLAKHPGLAEDLAVDHRIINDIRARFTEWCEISEKQVALVQKLAHEVRNPQEKPVEVHVPAPQGRVDFAGEVVSQKVEDSDFGLAVKICIKVATAAGSWLVWGTAPSSLLRAVVQEHQAKGVFTGTWRDGFLSLRGRQVKLRATLKPGREPHFAFMSRPMEVV